MYTVDFLSKKKKVNEGEVPQYYVEHNHDAIIEPAIFEAVQKQMAVRQTGTNRQSSVGIFSSKMRRLRKLVWLESVAFQQQVPPDDLAVQS